jgi:hypothetical protein
MFFVLGKGGFIAMVDYHMRQGFAHGAWQMRQAAGHMPGIVQYNGTWAQIWMHPKPDPRSICKSHDKKRDVQSQ